MWSLRINGSIIFISVTHKLLFYCSVVQLCPNLCDPVDCSPPGSSVHGISQARILEWVDIPFSRGSSQPRDRTQVSRIAGGFFTSWATREAQWRTVMVILQEALSLCLLTKAGPRAPVLIVLQRVWMCIKAEQLLFSTCFVNWAKMDLDISYKLHLKKVKSSVKDKRALFPIQI